VTNSVSATSLALHRTDIDGVPVLWAPGPGPLTATLVFSVGVRDEEFLTGGITHLVEHLSMATIGRVTYDCNACVGPDTTQFTVTGRPASVLDFLRRICQALADLPTERIAAEVGVLAAESDGSPLGLVGLALSERYGCADLGLLGFRQPAVAALDEATVKAHAGRYFVRENAVLWLTGEPPQGLELPLPAGVRNARAPVAPLEVPTPTQIEYPGESVVLSLEGERSPELIAALRIVTARARERLRHGLGLSYDIDWDRTAVDAQRTHLCIIADTQRGKVAEVAQGLVQVLREVAQDGPTAEELTHDLALGEEYVADPRAVVAELEDAADCLLRDEPYACASDGLTRLRELGAPGVAAALRAALDSLLVFLPCDHSLKDPQLRPYQGCVSEPISGRTLKRRLLRSDAPRGMALVYNDDAVALRWPADTWHVVRYDEVVGMGRWEGLRTVQGRNGCLVLVDARDWRGGAAVVAELDRRIPARLCYAERPPEE
jgi:hypothetical protein